ncbi:MAG: PAS-domain containing protein [Wenzhouxiangella sp.]|nr:PAS-domain containing protein [Wenzhouxiangella sp.]
MSGLTTPQLALAGVAWLGVLFLVAVLGERHRRDLSRVWPIIYTLSLAVYCTAWTFYGITTQAAANGWPVPPTFVGTIVFFVFGFGFLKRLAAASKANNSTSIADFVASRFGHSSVLAAMITAVAVIGIVPYISLQLKAVGMSVEVLTEPAASGDELATLTDSVFYVAIFMAIFAMLFGTRSSSSKDHNPGLVAAMGFESLLKLVAMLALGGFVLWGLFDGPGEWARQTEPLVFSGVDSFVVLMLLGVVAMFTLPHQFHIALIECRSAKHLNAARWLFPVFLVLIAMPVVPLARAGREIFQGRDISPDTYVLMLPLAEGQTGLALVAFLGGLSAATGMVILASLTLSIMMGNHWWTPASVALGRGAKRVWGSVRGQRRLGIIAVLALAYIYHRQVGSSEALADLGALSFSGLAQLGPAVVLAVYGPRLSATAVMAGLLAGMATWAYVLVWPLVGEGAWLSDGPWGWAWLSPMGLFGLGDWDPLARGVWLSLAINALVMAVFALLALRSRGQPPADAEPPPAAGLEVDVLAQLAHRFLPRRRAAEIVDGLSDPVLLEAALERELAAVVGSASARLLLDAARRQTPAPFEAVAEMVGAATRQAQFSYGVLSGALENMSQGVCVVDQDMRLVAWNSAYLELFDYPAELIAVGRPVADLLRHNAEQGLMGPIDQQQQAIDDKINRRLNFKRQGSRHLIERPWPDGRIIEIRGNPMPDGGFVATFTDVTEFRSTAEKLRQINETLEQRVVARTAELEKAKSEAETASEAKTRFLAAVSHDLVQPLNAAQLLTHSVTTRLTSPAQVKTLQQISGALGATERLIESLLDISRLDAGGLTPTVTRFPLAEVFDQLSGEFEVLAAERGLGFRAIPTSVWVRTDPQLLRRILQNFLSNATRYTATGRIVMGVRRHANEVMIGVWDTGPGITAEDRSVIFEEFRRLEPDQSGPGLGLGLAIAERMARLLDHPLRLESKAGGPTLFGVVVPRVAPQHQPNPTGSIDQPVSRGRVVVVDNDASMRDSLSALLGSWGYDVAVACDLDGALAEVRRGGCELLVLDYHLNQGLTGLDVHQAIMAAGDTIPAVMVSADHAAEVRQAAHAAGCEFLHKPIRPLALRSVITNILD